MPRDELPEVQAEALPRTIPLIVASVFFMEALDSTIITTALPAIAESFGRSPLAVSNAVTAYFVSLASFIPVSGWLADRFGTRNVFRAAVILYTIASVFCSLSPDLGWFVAARALQGVGGSMMVPVGRLILLKTMPPGQMVRAMSIVTTPALVGGVLGPLVGGLITTYFSWHWIFLMNVPIGIVGITLVSLFIPNHKDGGRGRFDIRGFLLTVPAVALLIGGLARLTHGEGGSSLSVVIAMAAGVVLAALALRHLRRHERPLVDLSIFAVPTFARSLLAGSFFKGAVAAVPFLLPLLFQVGFGMTPFMSGIAMTLAAVGALVMKANGPHLLRRFGFRTVLVGNSVACGLAIAITVFLAADTPLPAIAAVVFIYGLFRSLQYFALNTIAYAELPQARMSAGTSIASTVQELSHAVGVASSAVVLQGLVMLSAEELGAGPIHGALAVFGGVIAISSLLYLRLDRDAGRRFSGHEARR